MNNNAPTAYVRITNPANGFWVETDVIYYQEKDPEIGDFWQARIEKRAHLVWARVLGGKADELILSVTFVSFTSGYSPINAYSEVCITRSGHYKRYDNLPIAVALKMDPLSLVA